MLYASSIASVREILAQSCAAYATVTPKGLILPAVLTPYNPLTVTIIAYKPARTRYLNRKPICRSLDGLNSIDNQNKCVCCPNARTCTPQICLAILYKNLPLRLLLAFTSAKNFLSFLPKLKASARPFENASVTIRIIDRGRWGEVCFDLN
jgi:hypothetical protein